jgi:hypothetical protein
LERLAGNPRFSGETCAERRLLKRPTMAAGQSSRDATGDVRAMSGVECALGQARVVIPSSAIDRIVEYVVAPLPLARPCIAGIAVHEDELVLSVRLAPLAPATPRLAVLLVPRDGHRSGGKQPRARWGIEIDLVLSFVDIAVSSENGRAPWLLRATAGERELDWLDVDRMLRDLGDPTPGRRS